MFKRTRKNEKDVFDPNSERADEGAEAQKRSETLRDDADIALDTLYEDAEETLAEPVVPKSVDSAGDGEEFSTTDVGYWPDDQEAEVSEGGAYAVYDGAEEPAPVYEGAHAASDDEESTLGFGDHYQDYYNQSYDDAQAGPDALTSLEPMKTTSFQPIGKQQRPPRGSHAKPEPQLSERQLKSRRMRRVLIAVILVIIALMVVLGILLFQFVRVSQNAVIQQVQQEGSQTIESTEGTGDATDATSAAVRTTEVPLLTSVMGMGQDEAIAAIGHGAVVSGSLDVNEEGNPIRQRVTVVLTEEPADALSGTPTVYLGLNEEGKVIMAGYSAATASLGYGNLSFADAVQNENIVEKTLDEAGLSVPASSAVLPEDRAAYCTYASDGTTLVEENCTFNGEADVNGTRYTWSSMLMYNYTAANASGNLADTIRQIYIYINAA